MNLFQILRQIPSTSQHTVNLHNLVFIVDAIEHQIPVSYTHLSPGLNPLHYPAYLRFVQQTVAADPRIRILHAHNEAMGLYALKGAEKAGLQVRIAHAHNIWICLLYTS